MKYSWWKIAGVLLMLYVFVAGLVVPLKPGIIGVSPISIEANQTASIDIIGYNTHFESEKSTMQVWLKIDSTSGYKAREIKTTGERNLTAIFDIGALADTSEALLLVVNDLDGTAIRPRAVKINSPEDQGTGAISKLKSLPANTFTTKSGFYFPYRSILDETIRNTFFHVALWMSMFILLSIGLYDSIQYLRTKQIDYDIKASSYSYAAILYGLLGLATGSIWAKYSWGTWWTPDVKLNMAAITMLIYAAYGVLRSGIDDIDKRAQLSAIYNIFAFAAMIPLIFVIPRLTDSLHPGNGGNPAIGGEDLDNTLRMVFYPAIIGLFLLGRWIATLNIRIERLRAHQLESDV